MVHRNVLPVEIVICDLPKTIEMEVHSTFLKIAKHVSSERFVLVLKNARVALSECAIITADDELVEGIKPLFGHIASGIFYENYLPVLVPKVGKVVVLSNSDNYFHWLFEIIPRILLIQKAGLKPDYFVVGKDKKFKLESLNKLGISLKKIIPADKNLHIRAEELIVPSMPIHTGSPTPIICKFLRKTFLSNYDQKNYLKYKRVYIRRGNVKSRKVLNEVDVERLLLKNDFVSVTLDGLSIEEQAKIFSSAEIIVAAHGAALSNLVFCKKNTKVIEVFHPSYVNPCFWSLSNCVGLDYYYFLASQAKFIDTNLDINISPVKLSLALRLSGLKVNE
ncbi:MAG: glycosyltransferase family 61 protein [archaeon]